MNTTQRFGLVLLILLIGIMMTGSASAQDDNNTTPNETVHESTAGDGSNNQGLIGLGAGLAIGLAAIGTGMAQKEIGSAAIGAIAEDKANFVNSLIITALPELIIILGYLIANGLVSAL